MTHWPRCRRRLALVIGLALALLAVSCASSRPELGDSSLSPSSSVAGAKPVASGAEDPFVIADAVQATVPEVQAFDLPEGEPIWSLSNPGPFDGTLTLQATGNATDEWVQVVIPVKPNGTVGWVRRAEFTAVTTTVSIVVDLSERSVTLLDGDKAVLEVPVGIGTESTPTPELSAIVDHMAENPDAEGPYGAWTLGLNQHSEVMETFGGGRPAIALHGTADPSDIGERVSNGCIRIFNDDVVDLVGRVELGTPVIIHA